MHFRPGRRPAGPLQDLGLPFPEITTWIRANEKDFELVKQAGVKGLHYLSREELDFPADGWVDYVHPSDYGMVRQAEAVGRCLRGCVK